MKITLSHHQNQEFKVQNETGVTADLGCNEAKTIFTPMEMLLASLASCSSVDAIEIFEKKKFNVDHYSVDVEASRVDAIPAIFKEITITYHVKGNIDFKNLMHVIDLCINKYCSVADILAPTAKITSILNFNGTKTYI